VVRWSSATSFVSNSLIAFLFAPLVGDASDALGRKPFLIAGFVLALLPSAVVVGHLAAPAAPAAAPGPLLLFYYPASAVSGAVSTIVVCLSYCADKLAPRHRTAGFGLIIAAFSLGFVFGPGLGARLAPLAAAWVTLGATAVCGLAVAVAVPESLPPAVAAQRERGCGVRGLVGLRGSDGAPVRGREGPPLPGRPS
jgi:DHA1 family tetracycline resistance protein-like MFS transporter